jgi:hypothetical protein
VLAHERVGHEMQEDVGEEAAGRERRHRVERVAVDLRRDERKNEVRDAARVEL